MRQFTDAVIERTEDIERKETFVTGGLVYVTYCVYGGGVLILKFFLILVVAALARRQSFFAATPALKR